LPDWDWAGLTFRAVAEGAGVSESTVYRHFANERELHGAVMERLHELSGVDYSAVTLQTVADIGAEVFRSMASFAASRSVIEVTDPTISGIDDVRRKALIDAVQAEAPTLAASDQRVLAGLLDVLWSPTSYERLVVQWGLTPEQASGAIRHVIGLVLDGS
jgi:AcrR family transcriptional regulator